LRAPAAPWGDLHQAAVGVLAVSGEMPLETMVLLGVAADVDHLGAGVGLLRWLLVTATE
jgi:hypothetical protein